MRRAAFPSPLAKIIAMAAVLLAAACSPGADFGSGRGAGLPPPSLPTAGSFSNPAAPLAAAQGEVIGSGPVRVALLLPLSGNQSLSRVGTSMRNAARLAIESFGAASNIHLVVKDTGGDASRARAATQQAVSEGASLILGPLRADAVSGAGAVAREANIPLIGFSNTASVAAPGVYLLNVLPEAETLRMLSYARAQGRQSAAAIVPATDFGRAQQSAFEQAARETGFAVRSVQSFSDEAGARRAIEELVPLLRAGQIDTLFLPDRATAPSFGILLDAADISRQRLMLIGSADWDGDAAILNAAYLAGAVYPGVDPAGLAALAPDYQARFGGAPHPFATFAYTAVLLANNNGLVRFAPRYGPHLLTAPSGFNGRDGLFRFHHDGRVEYALAIRAVQPGGAAILEGPRLSGITLRATSPSGPPGNAIPPAAEFQ